MASVSDVAKYILDKKPDMTAMKLQKLVYYSQVWSLVWDEDKLFDSPIEAWANGPVVKELYDIHKGQFKVDPSSIKGDPSNLTQTQKETIDSVLEFYGDKTAQWLSDLAHMEEPWKKARERVGLGDGEKGYPVIELADMHEYYSGIRELYG
jgi:uncharacterized phage-associated protein